MKPCIPMEKEAAEDQEKRRRNTRNERADADIVFRF